MHGGEAARNQFGEGVVAGSVRGRKKRKESKKENRKEKKRERRRREEEGEPDQRCVVVGLGTELCYKK